LPDKVETYLEKLAKQDGDAAAWAGTGYIGEEKAALYIMNWNFIAGTLGEVEGQRFQEAADIATDENIPLVGVFSSGGARQHEGNLGLAQLDRMTHAFHNFKKRPNRRPYIAVLNGQVWGGISASAVPAGDVLVALRGTEYGFSGPRVEEAYSGIPVKKGEQSVELHSMYRNVDVLVNDEKELMDYLERLLEVAKPGRKKLTLETIPEFKIIREGDNLTSSTFDQTGFLPSDRKTAAAAESADYSEKNDLYAQYQALARSAERLDTQTIVSHVFSDVVNLYNGRVEHAETYTEDGDYETTVLRYPGIVASIGRIGPQPYLIIGNQPSYQRIHDSSQADGYKLVKVPAGPTPADYRYMKRMLGFGEKLGLPVVFFTDTLGAEPTLEAERNGQPREIQEALEAAMEYPFPVISIINGFLGSGGGKATTPITDEVMMLSGAQAAVAEPRSATAILYNTADPSEEAIRHTVDEMKVTAQDQLRFGLVNQIIQESDNPYITIKNIYDAIATTTVRLQSTRFRLLRRNRRIRKLGGFKLSKTRRVINYIK